MQHITLDLNDSYVLIETNEKISINQQRFFSIDSELVERLKSETKASDLFCELYTGSNGFELFWQANPDSNKNGRIRILKIEHFLSGIKAQYLDLTKDDELYYFHPIDLLSDEAHCGVFINDILEDRMFFHRHGEDEFSDLEISFRNYLTLANEAHGFFYWQKYLLEIISGESSPESENFKENMPEIFPEFSLEVFTAKFEQLRIK